MSEEITKGLPRDPSFEAKMLARLDSIDGRLQALEVESQRQPFDTKPIWERALAEILEVKQGLVEVNERLDILTEGLGDVTQGLSNVERKLDVLSSDIIQVRADQARSRQASRQTRSKAGPVARATTVRSGRLTP